MIGNILGGAMGRGPVQGDFESIATVILSGNQATVSFTSIPSTFQHLQLRLFPRTTANNGILLKINNDTGANYARHRVSGNGSTTQSSASTSQTVSYLFNAMGVPDGTSIFGGSVVDILDYANTNKFKTVRALSGFDANGSGGIELNSTSWQSTAAINRIDLTMDASANFTQYSHFALYGIKG